MSTNGSLFSQTLQDITTTKLNELAKKRDAFEGRRGDVLAGIGSQFDAVQKLETLAEGVKACLSVGGDFGQVVRGSTSSPRLEIDLMNLYRFLAQARYDPAVSKAIVGQWEQALQRHLTIQSVKFSYADLFGQLTTEWLSSKGDRSAGRESGDVDMDDFEYVRGGKKMESRMQWEESVFNPASINEKQLHAMLKSAFDGTPDGSKHLIKAMKMLRDKLKSFEERLMVPKVFTVYTVKAAVRGLLHSDLLDQNKRDLLKDFFGNDTVLKEIADILNVRLQAIDEWSWGSAVNVEQRRQLNGTWNVYMDEDLIQAIFLQLIGVKWSVFWKDAFVDFRKHNGVWHNARSSVPLVDKKRRDYFLGPESEPKQNVVSKRQATWAANYFLTRLQDTLTQETIMDEGDEEADFEEMSSNRPASGGRTRQTARKSTGGKAPRQQLASSAGGAKRHRRIEPEPQEYEDPEFDDVPRTPKQFKKPMEAKQNLLHLLSTDISIKTEVTGEITCFRSHFKDLYPGLPHTTILTVLNYFGVSERWTSFFKRFLEAPLRFADDPTSQPRKRQRGTPGAHVLSDVFSEVLLFCLDFQVNQASSGELLWRLGDDFWFWSSSHLKSIKAWSTINRFAKTTGLSLNEARTGGAYMVRKDDDSDGLLSVDVGEGLPSGDIRWGMLKLEPESGRFVIDQDMVSKHIIELKRQLQAKSASIFGWIQAWNTYAATFLTYNFGKPATCFGRQHVDDILSTHQRIQQGIFSGTCTSIVEYLKQELSNRFHTQDIPDGYFFLPTELGGLEVSSPFIGLLQIRDNVPGRPSELLDDFFEAEREAFAKDKADFEKDPTHEYHSSRDDPHFVPEDKDTFMSFEEWTKYREELHYNYNNELVDIWEKLVSLEPPSTSRRVNPGFQIYKDTGGMWTLMQHPSEQGIATDVNGEIMMALNALGRQGELEKITSNFYGMEPYWKWVAQLYGPELIEKFGGFDIVDPELLPMGLMSLLKSGQVGWQE